MAEGRVAPGVLDRPGQHRYQVRIWLVIIMRALQNSPVACGSVDCDQCGEDANKKENQHHVLRKPGSNIIILHMTLVLTLKQLILVSAMIVILTLCTVVGLSEVSSR